MIRRFLGISAVIAIMAGLWIVATPAAQAQSGGEQGEIMFLANMRRNTKVQTDISKMALKNSQSEAVKKLAHQVISEDRKSEMAMTGAAAPSPDLSHSYHVPKPPQQTLDAEKNMKKLTGTAFDKAYLAQLNAYLKDSQQAIEKASQDKGSQLAPLYKRLKEGNDRLLKQFQATTETEKLTIE